MDILSQPEIAPMQGKIIGVIIPPPEIRAVVEKTAQFVAKNGKSFEQRILSSGEGKTSKFNFMRDLDPYHAYYELKIREFEEALASGKDLSTLGSTKPAVVSAPTPAEVDKKKTIVASSAKATIPNPIAMLAKTTPKEAPYPLEFSIVHPSDTMGVNALDIDIIKLTAQYTAANGRDFLGALAQREQRNPRFDFLKPTHLLFSYFTSLVDSYVKIIHHNVDSVSMVKEKTHRSNALSLCVHRWGWAKAEEDRKREEASKTDADRQAFQQIDWNDFTVVEVIEFPEDELFDAVIPGQGRAPGQVPVTVTQRLPPPPPPPPVFSSSFSNITTSEKTSYDMDVEEDNNEDGIKVVSDYQPRISGATSASGSSAPLMMLDPVSGKPIPADQLTEHMRVQLLDPKWKEEQRRFSEKQKETGFAEGVSIADSLKMFAKKRGDIFGQAVSASTGSASAASIAAEELNELKRSQLASAAQWDGFYASAANAQRIKSEIASVVEASFPSHAPVSASAVIGPFAMPPPPPSMAMFGGVGVGGGAGIPPPPPPVMTIPPSAQFPMHHHPPPPPVVPVMGAMPGAIPPPPPAVISGIGAFPPFPPTALPPMLAPNAGIIISDDAAAKSKKARIDVESSNTINLIPAEEFSSYYPNPVTIDITVPSDASLAHWNLNGQTIRVQVSVNSSVKEIKDNLSANHLGNIPAGKFQIKNAVHGFLKDASTLASLNLGDATVLEISMKARGGKR